MDNESRRLVDRPLVVAVIDLGAYTARLEVVQVLPDGTQEILENLAHPLPLGNDVFATGRISGGNIRLTERILADFSRLMREYQVEHYKAVATSAVREALNRDIFLHRIREDNGIDIASLEGPEEARLIMLSVKDVLAGRYSLAKGNALVYTIGTGSSQLCFLRDGRMQNADTIRLGTLRLVHDLGEQLTPSRLREVVDPFFAAILNSAARMSTIARPQHLVAVGAPVRALISITRKRMPKYKATLTQKRFEKAHREIAGASVAELATRYDLQDVVAQSLEPCCHMVECLFQTTDTDRMVIPMVNTRDALVADLLREIVGKPDPFIPEIISSAECLGERYSYDAEHARSVADLAIRLYDELADLHRLPERCRLLLEVTALIHEIGLFVSNRMHHKHSYYLIRNSELPGISNEEQVLMATVARYHRRAMPRTSHYEYMSQPQDRRVMISKMAALLRVADALDRAHQAKVRDLRVETRDDRVLVYVKGPYDLTLEQLGMTRKADMFREVFGAEVVLVGQ